MSAETVKRNPLTKTTPKQKQILKSYTENHEQTIREIAESANVSIGHAHEVLQRYGITRNYCESFKKNRADIFAGMQDKLLSSIDEQDIKKAPLGSRIFAACQIYDKERLERGQSTANIAANHSISESLRESIDKIVGRCSEVKHPVDNTVDNYDKSQAIEIQGKEASD